MVFAHMQCCRCLRHKVIREVFYCHHDEDIYWLGQFFHMDKDKNYKTKEGEYSDTTFVLYFGATWNLQNCS